MRRGVLALVVAVAGITQVGHAQGAVPAEILEAKPTVQDQVLLRGRNRATLHPSEPLKIEGREQGENDMRSGTSALQRGKTATGGVSRDDNYRRAIAMVESRAMFTAPPIRASLGAEGSDVEVERHPRSPARTGIAAKGPAPASSNMPWALGGVVAAALAISGWLFVHNRS